MAPPESRPYKRAAYAHLADVGKALSSPARLELLDLLAQSPRTVEALAGEIAQSVANTSHHLQALKRARLVRSERDGLHVVYALAGDDVGGLVVQLRAVATRHLAELDRLQRDHFAERDGLEAIDRDELVSRLREGQAVLVDVRPEREFAAGHLDGALSVPLAQLESRLDALPRDRTIVAYCRGPFCTWSADAARRLRELGFDAVRAEVSVLEPLGAA